MTIPTRRPDLGCWRVCAISRGKSSALGWYRLLDVVLLGLFLYLTAGCSDSPPPNPLALEKEALSQGRWQEALDSCAANAGAAAPSDSCPANYCVLLAETMLFVDDLNGFLLPNFRTAELGVPPGELARYAEILSRLDRIATIADQVAAQGCFFDLPSLPFTLGDTADPVVKSEIRGRWTKRNVHLLTAMIDSVRYIFLSQIDAAPTPPPQPGSDIPGLPALLERIRLAIGEHDRLFEEIPADPGKTQGGWLDRNRNGVLDETDELQLDLFEPSTDQRLFDFSKARIAIGASDPTGPLTATAELPPLRCKYEKWHTETLFESSLVGTTDGMTFSPDGSRLILPIKEGLDYQLQEVPLPPDAPARAPRCLTCGGPSGWNDGARWQPNGNAVVFVSGRDHPFAIGGAGGGSGQELYAMRPDGSQITRLTVSPAWATNYHVNWSHDGKQLVWGTTKDRTWDVMVADFIDDAQGFRLANVKQLTHDTSWWETHDFTLDGTAVITTNTRAGWQSADLYKIDIASGARTRLTDHPAWDEHAHLSPDGRKLSWISARWRPAGMQRLTDGSLSPAYDFFWIAPAILFTFFNPPAGFSTELTMMDSDGANIQRLTFDDQVVADNVWSPDGRRIVFRQTPTRPRGPSRIQLLTFDDCGA